MEVTRRVNISRQPAPRTTVYYAGVAVADINNEEAAALVRSLFRTFVPEPGWVKDIARPSPPSLLECLELAKHVALQHPYNIGRDTCPECSSRG